MATPSICRRRNHRAEKARSSFSSRQRPYPRTTISRRPPRCLGRSKKKKKALIPPSTGRASRASTGTRSRRKASPITPGIPAARRSGTSLGALTPLGDGKFPCRAEFEAVAGHAYRIAVDGKYDSESGGPALRAFTLSARMVLPVESPTPEAGGSIPPPSEPGSEVDVSPPDTRIFRRVLKRRPPIFVFRFRSTERGSTASRRNARRTQGPVASSAEGSSTFLKSGDAAPAAGRRRLVSLPPYPWVK